MCVAYILVIGVIFYREMNWAFIRQAAIETMRTSAAVLIIVGAAAMFGWILAVEQVPQFFDQWFKNLTANPLMMLLVVNIIFFVAGMFVEFDDRNASPGADHRAARDGGRHRPDPSRHRGDLQPDDWHHHPAFRSLALSVVEHDRGLNDAASSGDAPVLSAFADHACAVDHLPDPVDLDTNDDAMT